MKKLTFIYKGSTQPNLFCEKLISKVVNLVSEIYCLPETIEIQFENMGASVYGMTMLDPRFPNRIRLNQDLRTEELILPITHELLHLHQIFTNRLQSRSGGKILWDKQMYKVDSLKQTYAEYQNLPWELDVIDKQKKLLEHIKKKTKQIENEIKHELRFAQNTTQSKPFMQ